MGVLACISVGDAPVYQALKDDVVRELKQNVSNWLKVSQIKKRLWIVLRLFRATVSSQF